MERKFKLLSDSLDENSNNSLRFEQKPWGSFTILDEGKGFKVKRVEILPLSRLSYQKHKYRAEHWFVLQGIAKVTLNDRSFVVGAGESIDVNIGAAHGIENPRDNETLIFIEIQRGAYLSEDDIISYSDDFGQIASAA